MATTLEVYTHASGSAQRDAVNLLENQLFPSVPKFWLLSFAFARPHLQIKVHQECTKPLRFLHDKV